MRKFNLSNTVVFVLNEHGEIYGKTNTERGSSGELLPECFIDCSFPFADVQQHCGLFARFKFAQ